MSFVQFGALFVESGDVISGTVLDGEVVSTGQGLWAAIVESGGTLVGGDIINFGGIGVAAGGVAIDTVVSDGLLAVEGVASNSLVLNSGTEEVAGGGVTISTTIEGGVLWVFSGGGASGTTVSGGAFELGGGSGGASAVDTTVNGGAFELGSGAVASATTVISGGTVTVG
jgi:autotransporter passenger strand-loop-strand repeat protein